jgi:hypothetical protein
MADETIPLSSVKKKIILPQGKRRRRIPRAPVAHTLKKKTHLFIFKEIIFFFNF